MRFLPVATGDPSWRFSSFREAARIYEGGYERLTLAIVQPPAHGLSGFSTRRILSLLMVPTSSNDTTKRSVLRWFQTNILETGNKLKCPFTIFGHPTTFNSACVAGAGIVRVRGKILTAESEYGRRSREENGKKPLWNLAAKPRELAAPPLLPRVGFTRATIFRQLRRLLFSNFVVHSYLFCKILQHKTG